MPTANPRFGNEAVLSSITAIHPQSTAWPSIDSLARSLIVPCPVPHHQAYGSSATNYIPLASALASSSSSLPPRGDPSTAFTPSQSFHPQGFHSGDARMINPPGARYPFGQATFTSAWSSNGDDPRQGFYPSHNMGFAGAGGSMVPASSGHFASAATFISPSASQGSALDRPIGRAFTLPPTPAPPTPPAGKTTPPFGFSKWASGSASSTFSSSASSQTATPIFGAPSRSVPPRYQTGPEVPISAAHGEDERETRVKVEDDQMNEDTKPPSEASRADLVPVQRDIKSEHLPVDTNETRSALVPFSANSSTHPKVIRAFPSLGSLNLATLTASQALFYFGVLTTQAFLMPRFEFNREISGRWGVKLTLYGHTLSRPELFGSQVGVKVEVCREALEILRVQYPQWVVPDEPRECLTSAEWNWVQLLHDYCTQNKVNLPKYTKYTHENGYRYEVELSGSSYFGALKFYPTDAEARNASAHMGLYSLLVYGTDGANTFPGPPSLRKHNECLLPLTTDALGCLPDDHAAGSGKKDHAILHSVLSNRPSGGSQAAPSRVTKSPNKPGQAKNKKQKKKKNEGAAVCQAHAQPKTKDKQDPPKQKQKNIPQQLPANLLPVVNPRIEEIEVSRKPEDEKRWTVSPRQIRNHIRPLATHREQLEKACDMLALEHPEFEIERTDGRLVDSEAEYRAAAFFPHDPFLARAGPIGEVKNIKGDRTAAREACSKLVVEYLIKMVEEDTVYDQEAAAQRHKIEGWRDNIISVYAQSGWMDVDSK